MFQYSLKNVGAKSKFFNSGGFFIVDSANVVLSEFYSEGEGDGFGELLINNDYYIIIHYNIIIILNIKVMIIFKFFFHTSASVVSFIVRWQRQTTKQTTGMW